MVGCAFEELLAEETETVGQSLAVLVVHNVLGFQLLQFLTEGSQLFAGNGVLAVFMLLQEIQFGFDRLGGCRRDGPWNCKGFGKQRSGR